MDFPSLAICALCGNVTSVCHCWDQPSEDMMRTAFRRLREQEMDHAAFVAKRMEAAAEAVPEHLRDTPEARTFLAVVECSLSNPLHPADAKDCEDRWRRFVEDHPAPAAGS